MLIYLVASVATDVSGCIRVMVENGDPEKSHCYEGFRRSCSPTLAFLFPMTTRKDAEWHVLAHRLGRVMNWLIHAIPVR